MDVKVKATLVADNVEWTIDGKKPKQSVLTVAPKSGAVKMDFKLNDHSGRDLRFDTSDPIWILETEQDMCPGPGSTSDQISVAECDNKRLSIVNANSGAARTLHYQLNFVDGDGAPEVVDPIIKNGGNTFV